MRRARRASSEEVACSRLVCAESDFAVLREFRIAFEFWAKLSGAFTGYRCLSQSVRQVVFRKLPKTHENKSYAGI